MSRGRFADLLIAGTPAFGVFAAHSPTEAASGAGVTVPDVDFFFYDLEEAEWDMAGLRAFVAWNAARPRKARPAEVLLRIPPVGPDPEGARRRVSEALAAGVGGLILPHVEEPSEVGAVASVLGPRLWSRTGGGDVVVVAQIESRSAVERVDEIVCTPGVGVVLPGQADLRRSYEGDEEAVQGAVRRVLDAGLRAGVPCGVTASARDVEARLEQGFEFIIAVEPGAVAIGRAAFGRES